MKKIIVIIVLAVITVVSVSAQREKEVTLSSVSAQSEKKVTLWGNAKLNSSTPGMIGGGLWDKNPSYTETVGVNVGNFSFSAFRTSDLLDKTTNANQTDISIAYGKKFGNWKVSVANDVLLFDNNAMNMLTPRIIGAYSKGNFAMEGMVSICPFFKGGNMKVIRLSPSMNIQGYNFRLFVWEKEMKGIYSTPVVLQIGKKLFQFENGNSLSAEVAYYCKDITAKELENFGWGSIQVNF